jgi:hypothetical protein
MTLFSYESGHLTISQAVGVRDAATNAWCMGLPMTIFVSIHLGFLNGGNPHGAINTYLKRSGDWLRLRAGNVPIFVYVIENPPNGGLNAHILAHVPLAYRLEYRCLMRGWLARGDQQAPASAVDAAVLHGADKPWSEEYLRHGLLGVLRYMLKGTDPAQVGALNVRHVAQGQIKGKRAGRAEALGPRGRWLPILLPKYPRIRLAGEDSRRRHMLLHLCPELLGLSPD